MESMIGICRQRSGNVKRWRDGQMAQRWCAAGMIEAGKQFRRVNGHLHLASLRAALEAEFIERLIAQLHDDARTAAEGKPVVRQTVTPACHDDLMNVA